MEYRRLIFREETPEISPGHSSKYIGNELNFKFKSVPLAAWSLRLSLDVLSFLTVLLFCIFVGICLFNCC